MTLEQAVSQISKENLAVKQTAYKIWDSIAKPLSSLGVLEDNIAKIAALTGDVSYKIDKRAVVVMCADNGVVAQGVTQTGVEITGLVAQNLTRGESCVCRMAKMSNTDVVPVDVGVCTDIECAGLINKKVAYGTRDISIEPAMTRAQCIAAIEAGIDVCCELQKQGYKIIATGEMGIGNTTTSSAMASVLLGVEPSAVTGKGAGLSSTGILHKIDVIEKSIAKHKPNSADPIDVICKVGGLDIAGMAGIFIGGAALKMPVIIDGFISAVSALVATMICQKTKHAMIASHVSAEPAGAMMLEKLGLEPMISAKMCMGEGTGAVAALPLLDMAFDIFQNMSTFQDIKMESYEHLK